MPAKTEDEIRSEACSCCRLAIERAAEAYDAPSDWSEEDFEKVRDMMNYIAGSIGNLNIP